MNRAAQWAERARRNSDLTTAWALAKTDAEREAIVKGIEMSKPIDEPIDLNHLRMIMSGLIIPNRNAIQRICYQLRKLMGDPHPGAQ
jgi:hypothetical protein